MSKLKVLVVDNSPVILRIMSNVLKEAGCRVRSVEDGLEALDVLGEFSPDVVITDLVMPKIDGAKLCYIIRTTPAYKNIFLVVISGIALEDDMNILDLGADVCIAKGPAGTMKKHVLSALDRFRSGERGSMNIEGVHGLYPREVTRELLVNQRHNDVIFDRMTEGVLELDGNARIIRANPVCCTLFDCSETELLGMVFPDLLPEHPGEIFSHWLSGLSHAADPGPLLYDYERPIHINGRQVTCNLVPIFENEQIFVIGILQDVTGRKHLDEQKQLLEKELQHIRKLDAMAIMASGIAHDFNNLLTIINGNIEMAKVLSKDNEINTLLNETGKALQLTNSLIRTFSTFSDNYLPSKSLVCIDEMLNGLLNDQLAGTGVSFEITSEKNVSCIDLDTDLIVQVFHNIIVNAVEAMEGKGKLTVDISRVEGAAEAKQTGLSIPAGDFIRVKMVDSGPGIQQQILDQVFDPYFSTKQRGTQKGMGLGLTIAHSIVKKHGGVLRLDSTSSKGTTAWVYLPSTRLTDDNNGCLRILVLDDDEMMRTIISRMFEQFNTEVTTVVEGSEAVDMVKKGARQGLFYDLILLDLRIDRGMNGVEAAEKIYAIDPQASMVAMSGDGEDEVMLCYQDYHFCTAVAKPFSMDIIEKLLKFHVRHKSGGQVQQFTKS